MQSQIGQDKFVVDTLNSKKQGTFLDIGCHDYKYLSNSHYLEMNLEWRGVGVELDCSYEQNWLLHRPNTKFVCADAITLDYQKVLEENNMPKVIDYLSLDLEPPSATYEALLQVFKTDYLFRVVTFETDWYRYKDSQAPSREFFKSKGYVLLQERNNQDDFYVHQSVLESTV
jgi:hypothetical protein